MIEVNQGEIVVKISEENKGKLTFAELGLTEEDCFFEGGLLRIVFEIAPSKTLGFYQKPTFELKYKEKMEETHWSVDFNGKKVLDTTDHSGNATLLLLNKKELEAEIHRHENNLILHAQFTSPAHVQIAESFITLF